MDVGKGRVGGIRFARLLQRTMFSMCRMRQRLRSNIQMWYGNGTEAQRFSFLLVNRSLPASDYVEDGVYILKSLRIRRKLLTWRALRAVMALTSSSGKRMEQWRNVSRSSGALMDFIACVMFLRALPSMLRMVCRLEALTFSSGRTTSEMQTNAGRSISMTTDLSLSFRRRRV